MTEHNWNKAFWFCILCGHPKRELHYLFSVGKTSQQRSSAPGAADSAVASLLSLHLHGPIWLLHCGSYACTGHLGASVAAASRAQCTQPHWGVCAVLPFCAFDFFSWQSLSSQANPNVWCAYSGPPLQQNYPTAVQVASPLRNRCFRSAKPEVNGSAKRLIKSWKYQNSASYPKHSQPPEGRL